MLQGPRAATAVLLKAWSPRSATREGTAARSPHTAVKSSPHLPQLEKAFFSDQCKEIEENNRMGKTRDENLLAL